MATVATSGGLEISAYPLLSPPLLQHIQEVYEKNDNPNKMFMKACVETIMNEGRPHLPRVRYTRAKRYSDKAGKGEFAASAMAKVARSQIQIWDAAKPSRAKFMGDNEGDVRASGEEEEDDIYLKNFLHLRSSDTFYRSCLDRAPILDENGDAETICSHLYYPPAFNNAFYNPSDRKVYFGDTDPDVFLSFAKNREIITHELGHAVVASTSALIYQGESGALNESLADVFAIMHKHFASKTKAASPGANWLIGDGIVVTPVGLPNQSLRSLFDPGTAYSNHFYLGSDRQPKHMDNLLNTADTSARNDYGNVHSNSGIPNHAFYKAAYADQGNSWEKIGKIWYKALVRSNADDGFVAFAKQTSTIAKSVGGEACENLVKKAWFDVGVSVDARRGVLF
ncbi:MAG: Protease PrtS [Chlamydiae bacterium]|nr:Protease PrtS [Chlamydiota bacterium]